MALVSSGLASLARALPEAGSIRDAGLNLVSRILERRHANGFWVPDFSYVIRGQPIDPASGDPCVINSVFCAAALLEWHGIEPGLDLGRTALEAIRSVLRDLPVSRTKHGRLFAYHPQALYFVHNSSVLLAATLAWAAGEALEEQELRLINDIVDAVWGDFTEVGSPRYAPEPTPSPAIDNFHTGYLIRALLLIASTVPDPGIRMRAREAADRLAEYYFDHFVLPTRIAKYPGGRLEQSHSLAEAILLFSHSARTEGWGDEVRWRSGLRASFAGLWHERSGRFVNEAMRIGGVLWQDNTPMPRWSWAWMFLALSRELEADAHEENDRVPCHL